MERTRRNYPRKRVYLPVEYSSAGGTHETHAFTLGGGGLFLGISENIATGTNLILRFRPAQHLGLVEAKAKVCYQIPDQGIGIEFTEIKPEHREMILQQIGQRMAEKRIFPRAPLAIQVEHEAGSLIGISKDISIGGMFIESDKPISVDSKLRIRFHLGDGGPIVKARVEIRYVVAQFGVGVEFVEISPDDRGRIEAYVAKGDSSR